MVTGSEASPRRRWPYPWIYLALVLLNSVVPQYTATGYAMSETGSVVSSLLRVSLAPYLPLAPVFHVATFLLIISVWRWGNRARRGFALYLGANYVFIAVAQGIDTTERYGLVILTGGVISFILVGFLWFWEALRPQNDVRFRKLPLARYWPVPLALLAFWFPIGREVSPSFDPRLLLTSPYGIAYCPTTPVFVCWLTLMYPRVNEPVYRITAFVGVIYALWNMLAFLNPRTRWLGVLHLPLLCVCSYALALPRLMKKTSTFGNSARDPSHVLRPGGNCTVD